MMSTHNMKNKKQFIIVSLLVVLLGVAILIVLQSKDIVRDYSNAKPEDIVPYRTKLAGEYVCLPHKDTTGPVTQECAFGVKLDDGTYYAISFNLMSAIVPDIATGNRIYANGTITPIEMLSSTHLRDTYDIKGIFSVTDSLVVEK